MAGRKRAADTDSPPTTRAAKVAKRSPKDKKGSKQKLSTTAFKTKALPIHVNLSHTAPPEDETENKSDPGFLGAVALVPTSFATGTYGWKGSKRITVEVDVAEGTEKEKLQVQLTINATVMGSKGAKGEEAEEDETGVVEKADNEKPSDEEHKAVEGDEDEQ